MSSIDWVVLFGTLGFIVAYGAWKTRGSKDLHSYLLGSKEMKWWTIGLSIIATQASAITFLSTPGVAYESGMKFIQFYLGLPIAMVLISVFFIPLYYKLKVYTAYEFLESRFDLKNRQLAAFLFLVQRGLAAGITIFAPAIILSSVLGWSLVATNLLVGILVIIYTVSGGTKAVALTQKYQLAVIMLGMTAAFVVLIYKLPAEMSFFKAIDFAGDMGKMQMIDTDMSLDNRYNILTAFTAAIFLFMSYFGTDQSQVQRYLSGKSIKESRMGLLMNGVIKVPMQFFILLIGVFVFVFYQFEQSPLFFDQATVLEIQRENPDQYETYQSLECRYDQVFVAKREAAINYMEEPTPAGLRSFQSLQAAEKNLRSTAKEIVKEHNGGKEHKDTNYVFISFIMGYLPQGLIGLLFAVIFSAAMSSTAGELNSLASTTTIDFYKRSFVKNASDAHYLRASKAFTLMWGLFAIAVAMVANLAENLVELVNILGSLIYGTILGIFVAAFFFKQLKGHAVFIAAFISESVVLYCYFFVPEIAYLWFNAIGCIVVIIAAYPIQALLGFEKELSQ